MKSQSAQFSLADFAALLCAIVLGVAFFVMPWAGVPDSGTTVTGNEAISLLTEFASGHVSIATIYFVPMAVVVAFIAALVGLIIPSARKATGIVMVFFGILSLIYFLTYFTQTNPQELNEVDYVRSGFWIGLLASLGLILQLFIPRWGVVDGSSVRIELRDMIPQNVWTYVFLGLLTAFVLFPLLITVTQSFMTNQEINRWPPKMIPTEPTLEGYKSVVTQQDIRLDLWLRNSLLAAAGHTLAVLILTAPAAYAFARLRFPGNKLLFGFLLVTIMIPGQVTLIPNYILMRDLHWIDTFNALIFPGAANVFGVFLLRQFFMQIPMELEEAAVLDGASYFGRLRHVILPLSTNALTALGIFVFLGHYNDLFWPIIVTSSLETRTLPVGLSIIQSSYAGQYRPMILAGAVLSTMPILIVYTMFQRRIIQGVTLTGMGGR